MCIKICLTTLCKGQQPYASASEQTLDHKTQTYLHTESSQNVVSAKWTEASSIGLQGIFVLTWHIPNIYIYIYVWYHKIQAVFDGQKLKNKLREKKKKERSLWFCFGLISVCLWREGVRTVRETRFQTSESRHLRNSISAHWDQNKHRQCQLS